MIPTPLNHARRYRLQVLHLGRVEIDASIAEIHAQMIALLAVEGGKYCRRYPDHTFFLMGRILQTVEASLQGDVSAHSQWLRLCESYQQTIQIELEAVVTPAEDSIDQFSGGAGGNGGWFGAGGGGGGTGLLNGGVGGSGAAGAMLIFQVGGDGSLLDIDAFVVPGSFLWSRRSDTKEVRVIAIGGGGGGGGGSGMASPA
ncbi:hypothetical protein [Nocardia sp. NPDC050435]|uniref:hypothetical protein n=1 Tax=Nocardia sp. NPDC050435 TaxID=3155040 RepID=UPI0033E3A0C8